MWLGKLTALDMTQMYFCWVPTKYFFFFKNKKTKKQKKTKKKKKWKKKTDQSWVVMSPPTNDGGGTYCFWDGSRWRRHKTSCPLCNVNTLWNILMILGRNVDQDEMTYCIQDWQLWLSYFWSYHPLFYLKKISCPLCNLNILWNISMVLGRNVEQDEMTCNLQERQLCLSYFWRYLPLLYLTVIIRWPTVSQRPPLEYFYDTW